MIIDLAVTWWQFTVVGILIVIGFIINMFGVDNEEERIGFEYNVMPQLRPIAIPTAGKGFWGAIWMWITGTRHWEVADDWSFTIEGQKYIIPQGFRFDGASIPKFLHTWLSPTVFFSWVDLFMTMLTSMKLYLNLVRKKQWERLLKNVQMRYLEISTSNRMVFIF